MVYYPTWKGGRRMEPLRHYFHEDMAVLLEADPAVVKWSAQVESLDVEHDDGVVREFRPSMRAEVQGRIRLIKLHDDSRRGPPEVAGRRRAWPVAARGISFERYTRSQLAKHPRLRTSQDIIFHRSRDLPRELPLQAASLAAVSLPRTLGELHERLGRSNVVWEDVLSLVAQGYVEVDMGAAVGPGMSVVACHPWGYLG